MAANSQKIVLLGRLDKQTAILYNSLQSEFSIARVIVEERESRLKFMKRRIKRWGWRRALGELAFRVFAVPCLQAESRSRVAEIIRESGGDTSPVPTEKLTHVASVNSDEVIQILRELQPSVVLVSGTRIIAARILTCVPAVFINMHAGITPMYRGVHGGYWALVEGNIEACGVTVHEVDCGVDTGRILGQARIAPQAADNFVTYSWLQLTAGLPLLKKAVRNACHQQLQPLPVPSGESRLWTHPTLAEYVYHRLKSGVK
jgi:methionyl-tRNA formyltransferase